MLCAVMALGTVGCGGSGSGTGAGSGTGTGGGTGGTTGGGSAKLEKTVINIQGYEAGVNLNWLRDLTDEYEEAHKDIVYEEGKKGVEIKVEGVPSTDHASMNNVDIHLYVSHGNWGQDTAQKLGGEGKLMDVTDVIKGQAPTNYTLSDGSKLNWTEQVVEGGQVVTKTIEDYILPDYRPNLMSGGKYYGVPSYGIRRGLSYDANVFDEFGFYLAAPDAQTEAVANKFDGEFGSRWFCKTKKVTQGRIVEFELVNGARMACGPDGVYGTSDDGLPGSLEEFFILCEYMLSRNVSPISSYADAFGYRSWIIDDVWCALSSYEAYQAKYSYKGKVEIVTDFSDEPIWDNDYASEILKPITKVVDVTPGTGYLAYHNVARYYGMAFMRILKNMEAYSSFSDAANITHLEGEKRFVLNKKLGERCGFLREGDYWYNESKKAGNIAEYEKTTGKTEPIDIRWFYYPEKLTGTAIPNTEQINTPENPVAAEFYNEHVENIENGKHCFINSRFDGPQYSDDLRYLIKDIFYYINNGRASSYYSGNQGVFRVGMDYPILEEDMGNLSAFQKTTFEAYSKPGSKRICPAELLGVFDTNIDDKLYNGGSTYFSSSYVERGKTKESFKGTVQEIFLETVKVNSKDWMLKD